MLIIGIDWSSNWVQIITGGRTYNCPMEERSDDFYFKFKKIWYPVSEYADEDLDADIKDHKLGVYRKRESITQAEFERICTKVLSRRTNIIDYWFEELGIVHVSYPSHSGRSRNGATLYFGENGYITYKDWQYKAGSNEGYFIGKEISKRIHSALYT